MSPQPHQRDAQHAEATATSSGTLPPPARKERSTREVALIIAALANDAEALLSEADDFGFIAQDAGSDGRTALAQQASTSAIRNRLHALRCITAGTRVFQFLAWASAAGHRIDLQHSQERREAAWAWCVDGCPEACPCPKCGGQMEECHNDADQENNVSEFHGLVCPLCAHAVKQDDHDRPLRIAQVCKPPVIGDVR